MTKKQYAVLALAGILCVGLLGACSSGQNSEEENVTSSPAVADEDSTDENDDVSEALYAAGVVLSVDGDQVVLQLYEDEDGNGGIADPDAFLPEDYTLSTETLTLTDDVAVYMLADGCLVQADAEDLLAGDTVIVTLSSDGAPVQLICVSVSEDTGTMA